jgi:2-(1,2-epoxy-1,2-dihydrophenyl)acetyl-CoA isomerase
MTDSPVVVVETNCPGVSRITLNRPEKRNALDIPTREALYEAIEAALASSEVRAIVLTGAGGCFCAGGDILSMAEQTAVTARARMKWGHRFVKMLALSDKPIVAAVEGHAAGAGASLALLCDVIVAGESAKFSFPFVRLGLIPDWGLLQTLPGRVGIGTARRLLMTNATVAATEGERLRLIDYLVPDLDVQTRALSVAVDFANGPSSAIAMVKQGLAMSGSGASLDAVLEYEAIAQSACFIGPEFAERLRVFRQSATRSAR